MDTKEEQRRILRSNDSSMTRALELVVTPLVFGAGGAWLDNRFGTFPRLTLVLGVLGVIGVFAKAWYIYKAQMDYEQAKLAARIRPPKPVAATTDTIASPPVDAPDNRDGDAALEQDADTAPDARGALVGEWS